MCFCLLAVATVVQLLLTATRRDNVKLHNELYHTKYLFIAVHEIQVFVILTVGTVDITHCTRVNSLPLLRIEVLWEHKFRFPGCRGD
jgi:hypothetical protein